MHANSPNEQEVFLAALEHEDAEHRSAYLNEACGNNRPLRRRVERLLSVQGKIPVFLETPASLATTVGQSITNLPGTQLGPYTLLKQLGRGAMGVVYEAEQTSVGRRVALKILPFAALLNETQLERFNTEATAAARLQHDHIVPIYTVGCERGIHFYSMQLIEGPSLSDVIAGLGSVGKEKQESADTVVAKQADILTRDEDGGHYRAVARIGRQAAEALQYAHEHGVLHRDIKPSNLLLDKTGHVWIADFGLARIEDESQLTRTGDILGTLHYMSPEQATGERVDARSDVYSLGATLYELATLQPVYDAEDRRDIIKQVLAGNPLAPHKIDRRIPRPLSRVISKALARLEERYQSAQELADDLRRFLDGEPVHARAPSPLRRAKRTLQRHPLITLSSTALLIVACLYIPNVLHRLGTNEPEKSSVTSSTDTRDPTMFRSAPKKRTSRKNERIRQLRHEQLEDRRLLTTGSISGTVFDDLNANGVADAGEGIADTTVVLQTDFLTITNPSTDMMASEADPQEEDVFGWAVESMGNNILVAAHKEDPDSVVNAGAVYLFNGLTGERLQTFTSPDARVYDRFGTSIAGVGEYVVVGTRRDHQGGSSQYPRDPGIAYLFDQNGGLIQTYHDPNPETEPGHPTTDNWFGGSFQGVAGYVAGDGSEYVLIGSQGGLDDPGAVYMYPVNGVPEPEPIRVFTAEDTLYFGRFIAVQGDKLVVVDTQDSANSHAGAVYLFDINDPTTPLWKFERDDPQPDAKFGGGTVATTDQYVFVGAQKQDVDGVVYMIDISTGECVHEFHSPNPGNPLTGELSASGDHLLIGSFEDDSLGDYSGAGYLFSISTKELITTFYDPTPANDYFGARNTILENGNFVLGCGGDDAAGHQTGSVFVFESPHMSKLVSTDQNGNYSFTDLPADTYVISEVVPDGYIQTAPGGDGTHTVAVASGPVDGIDFGNFAYTTFGDSPYQPLQDAHPRRGPGVTTSTIDVSGLSNILDLNVTVDIAHSYVGQLSARLIAPDGTPVELFNNVGGDGDNFTATEFDDEATVPITSGAAPFTGTFQPAGSLAVLDDIIANGEWKLEITDNAKGETGTLNSWALDIAMLPAGNTSPVAVDDDYLTTVDTELTVAAPGVLGNDTDPDGDTLSASLVSGVTDGVLTLNTDGSFTYTPSPGFTGSDSFTYTANDGTVNSNVATVTIDVQPLASSDLSINDFSRNEGRKNTRDFNFTVTRAGGTSNTVTVNYATADGPGGLTWATAGEDYIATNGTLTFLPGDTTKTVTVRVNGDRTAELDEMFYVILSDATGGATISDTQGVGTIVNDDGAMLLASFQQQTGASALALTEAQHFTSLALALWSAQSQVAMPEVIVTVDNLPPGQLGEALGNTITLDINANGAGWYMDLTAPQAGRVDLLTVVTHEIGHLLGYGHSSNTHDVMAATLPVGTRRLPGLEPITVEPVMLGTLPNLELNTRTPVIELPTTAKSLDTAAETNFDLFLDPLVMDHMQQTTSRPEAIEVRMLDDIVDDETELVEEELLDLLLG